MTYQSPLVVSNVINHTPQASIIWLHGLGADGYDFEPVAQQLLQQLNVPNLKFILPHAPEMAVTRNNGYIMPAWYDVYGVTPISKEDANGIKSSQNYINALIENEINAGVRSERIMLAGFSQGGAIALHTALRYQQKLGGVLALSTYLPLKHTLTEDIEAKNANTPMFIAHGTFDDIISLEACHASLEVLKKHSCTVEYHEYKMAHSVCTEEINDIRDFILQILQ
jgi:phospholipase/carboxylesterase